MPRKPQKHIELARKFVTEHLKREWTMADFRGSASAHAAQALKLYELPDIIGCLDAIRDGVIETYSGIRFISQIFKGEPPLIESWMEYKNTPPPIYMESAYRDWLRRTGGDEQAYIESMGFLGKELPLEDLPLPPC